MPRPRKLSTEFGQHDVADRERGGDDDRRDDVGQDVANGDPPAGRRRVPGRRARTRAPSGQRGRAHQPRHGGPADQGHQERRCDRGWHARARRRLPASRACSDRRPPARSAAAAAARRSPHRSGASTAHRGARRNSRPAGRWRCRSRPRASAAARPTSSETRPPYSRRSRRSRPSSSVPQRMRRRGRQPDGRTGRRALASRAKARSNRADTARTRERPERSAATAPRWSRNRRHNRRQRALVPARVAGRSRSAPPPSAAMSAILGSSQA